MPDSAGPGRSLRAGAVGPGGLIALFLVVPLVLAVAWLLRGAPPVPECGVGLEPHEEAVRQSWLAGARLAFGAGALVVLAGILRVSALRQRDRRPGPATLAIGILLGLYVITCVAVREAFGAYALVFVFAVVFWYLSVPLLVLVTVMWFVRRPPNVRPLAALALLGWCSLLLGVGTGALFVAARGSGPFLC
jgi:hypothetical protein